ncbi:hypothetical protein [Tissierella sp.]|uniref:tetratricopeptide repeat protein n=1 Tax=Tissierella sp. TaxID=41274 RepID=UPI003037C047
MKSKDKRSKFILLILLFTALVIKTYNAKNAEIVITEYYSCIKRQDYQGAYKYLSKDTKEDIPFNKFKEFYTVKSEIQRIESLNTSKGQKNNGIVTIPVIVETAYLYESENKVLENSFTLRLVPERMNYRLILELSDFDRELSQTYVDYVWEKYIFRNDIDNDKAVETIDKAIELDKDNPDIYYTRAIMAEKNEDALFLLDKSIELAKKRDYWHLSYAYNMKGEILKEQGKLRDAKNNFIKAIEENKENEIASKNLKEIEVLLALKDREDDKKEVVIQTAEEKEVNKEVSITQSDKKYINKILTITEDYVVGLEKIYELLENANQTSEDWLTELALSILFIQANCDAVDELSAPDKFTEMHKELIEVSKNFRLAMDNLAHMVDNPSISNLDRYKANIETASKYMKKVINEANDAKSKYGF